MSAPRGPGADDGTAYICGRPVYVGGFVSALRGYNTFPQLAQAAVFNHESDEEVDRQLAKGRALSVMYVSLVYLSLVIAFAVELLGGQGAIETLHGKKITIPGTYGIPTESTVVSYADYANAAIFASTPPVCPCSAPVTAADAFNGSTTFIIGGLDFCPTFPATLSGLYSANNPVNNACIFSRRIFKRQLEILKSTIRLSGAGSRALSEDEYNSLIVHEAGQLVNQTISTMLSAIQAFDVVMPVAGPALGDQAPARLTIPGVSPWPVAQPLQPHHSSFSPDQPPCGGYLSEAACNAAPKNWTCNWEVASAAGPARCSGNPFARPVPSFPQFRCLALSGKADCDAHSYDQPIFANNTRYIGCTWQWDADTSNPAKNVGGWCVPDIDNASNGTLAQFPWLRSRRPTQFLQQSPGSLYSLIELYSANPSCTCGVGATDGTTLSDMCHADVPAGLPGVVAGRYYCSVYRRLVMRDSVYWDDFKNALNLWLLTVQANVYSTKESGYEQYFAKCAPKSCTYTDNFDVKYFALKAISLVGGVVAVWRALLASIGSALYDKCMPRAPKYSKRGSVLARELDRDRAGSEMSARTNSWRRDRRSRDRGDARALQGDGDGGARVALLAGSMAAHAVDG